MRAGGACRLRPQQRAPLVQGERARDLALNALSPLRHLSHRSRTTLSSRNSTPSLLLAPSKRIPRHFTF